MSMVDGYWRVGFRLRSGEAYASMDRRPFELHIRNATRPTPNKEATSM